MKRIDTFSVAVKRGVVLCITFLADDLLYFDVRQSDGLRWKDEDSDPLGSLSAWNQYPGLASSYNVQQSHTTIPYRTAQMFVS